MAIDRDTGCADLASLSRADLVHAAVDADDPREATWFAGLYQLGGELE